MSNLSSSGKEAFSLLASTTQSSKALSEFSTSCDNSSTVKQYHMNTLQSHVHAQCTLNAPSTNPQCSLNKPSMLPQKTLNAPTTVNLTQLGDAIQWHLSRVSRYFHNEIQKLHFELNFMQHLFLFSMGLINVKKHNYTVCAYVQYIHA